MSSIAMYRPGVSGPEPGSVPVTVLILTKNEAPNIARNLASTSWASQQIVIDSGSTDATIAIATESGAEVVSTHWRGFGPQREWAIQLPAIKNEWVFFVDADEWISESLAVEIQELIAHQRHDAYALMFRLIFLGRWIAHCGWYPSARKTVLFRKDKCRYSGAAFAEHPIIDGTTAHTKNDLVDEDLKPFSQWLHKHVDYSRLEAARQLDHQNMRVAGSRLDRFLKKRVAPRLPGRPVFQFVYMYILRLGFLDGWQGLIFCFMHSWFQTVVWIEKRQLTSGELASEGSGSDA